MLHRLGFEPAIDRLVDVTIHSLDLLPCDIMLLNSGEAYCTYNRELRVHHCDFAIEKVHIRLSDRTNLPKKRVWGVFSLFRNRRCKGLDIARTSFAISVAG